MLYLDHLVYKTTHTRTHPHPHLLNGFPLPEETEIYHSMHPQNLNSYNSYRRKEVHTRDRLISTAAE